jgi:glycosyltransferase involved in cell wall biosynthesis
VNITFSIIICNYNYGHFLSRAIQSCLCQGYSNELFEIIVVDDGSTDNSKEVLESFHSVEERLKIVYQKNEGQASAIASGLKLAKNNYICLLDSDDYFLPNKLSVIANKLKNYQNTDENFFLCHDLKLSFEATGEILEKSWFELNNISRTLESICIGQIEHPYPFANPAGQVYSKKLLAQILDSMPTSDWKQGADNPLAQAALIITGQIHYLNEELAVYCSHDQNFFLQVQEYKLAFKQDWKKRWPKLIYFLDNLIDSLDFTLPERNKALAYLRRLERVLKVSSKNFKFAIPKISFIITNYNYAKYLPAAIQSVLAQTHNNIELIIVDDKSTDESQKIILDYQQKYPELFKAIFHDTNLGQLGSIASGYSRVESDYFCILDADDILDRNFAERHLYTHQYSTLCMVTSSDIRFIDQANKLIHASCYHSAGSWTKPLEYFGPFSANLDQWIFAPCSANMFRKTKMLNLFFNSLDQAIIQEMRRFGDWLLLYYAQILGGSTRLNECLGSFRLHDKNHNTQLHFPTPYVKALGQEKPNNLAAGIYFFKLLCNHYKLFQSHYSESGLSAYISWLSKINPNVINIIQKLAVDWKADPALLQILG